MFGAKLAVVLAVAGSALAQSISTPASLVECQPAALTFSGGTSPYILAVIPGGEVSAAAIETISSDLTSSPYTWTVNIVAGTNITLKLTDATGSNVYSAPLVIQAGSSSSCLNTTASTSGVSTGAVTTTVSSSAASGSSAASSAAASSAAASSAASSAAASSAASSAAATSAAAATVSSAAAAATSAAASAASAATSAAASATSKSGAVATGIAALPVLAAGLAGGFAALF